MKDKSKLSSDEVISEIAVNNGNVDPKTLPAKVLSECVNKMRNAKLHIGHPAIIRAYDIFLAEENRRGDKSNLWLSLIGAGIIGLIVGWLLNNVLK